MHMNGWNRALTTLLAAGAAGFLLWLAAQFDMHTTGGYWAALGIVAGCGLLLGLGQLRGAGGNPPAMLLLGFLPVLVCAGWIIVAAEPHGNWFRHHVTAWRPAGEPLADVDGRATVDEILTAQERHLFRRPEGDDCARLPLGKRGPRDDGVGWADDRQLAGGGEVQVEGDERPAERRRDA